MVRLSMLSTHIQVATKSEHPSKEFAPARINEKKFSKEITMNKRNRDLPTSIGQVRGTYHASPKDEFRFAHLQRAGRPPLADSARPPLAGGVCVTSRAGPQFSKNEVFKNKMKQARHIQPAGSTAQTT